MKIMFYNLFQNFVSIIKQEEIEWKKENWVIFLQTDLSSQKFARSERWSLKSWVVNLIYIEIPNFWSFVSKAIFSHEYDVRL